MLESSFSFLLLFLPLSSHSAPFHILFHYQTLLFSLKKKRKPALPNVRPVDTLVWVAGEDLVEAGGLVWRHGGRWLGRGRRSVFVQRVAAMASSVAKSEAA
jgi:hypothetical protein